MEEGFGDNWFGLGGGMRWKYVCENPPPTGRSGRFIHGSAGSIVSVDFFGCRGGGFCGRTAGGEMDVAGSSKASQPWSRDGFSLATHGQYDDRCDGFALNMYG